ncbi:MAG: hypothetical protein KatS3mg097_611 [Candidatus Parcubacteria bacterium]|nr:MAG: hypothetical protein KatS3mg097_611 [Candidatus Parcubacteria bacterium]
MVEQQNTTKLIVLLIFRFLISYIKSFFLTGSVVFSVGILLFIILNINQNFSFGFLKYFSFVNPLFKEESFSMGIKEIMQLFLFISFIFMIIIGVFKVIMKKMFKMDIDLLFSFKSRLIVILSFITVFYIISFFIVALNENLDKKGFYIVFIIFYIINLFCTLFYFLFDFISKKIKIQEQNSLFL